MGLRTLWNFILLYFVSQIFAKLDPAEGIWYLQIIYVLVHISCICLICSIKDDINYVTRNYWFAIITPLFIPFYYMEYNDTYYIMNNIAICWLASLFFFNGAGFFKKYKIIWR
jgi:hypothetical protein